MSSATVKPLNFNVVPVYVPSVNDGQIFSKPCPHIYRWFLCKELEGAIPCAGRIHITADFVANSSIYVVKCRKCELNPLQNIEVIWVIAPIKLFLSLPAIPLKSINNQQIVIFSPPLGILDIDRSGSLLIASRLSKHILQQEAMTWLSTLGGGFSCLGDRFEDAAEIAGRISIRQMHLALSMKIPVFQARCRLFYAQSLMQRGQLNAAARMIRDVYTFSKTASAVDNPPEVRLNLMCQGLWKRLSYLWTLRKESRSESRRQLTQAPYPTTGCGRRLYKDINEILRII